MRLFSAAQRGSRRWRLQSSCTFCVLADRPKHPHRAAEACAQSPRGLSIYVTIRPNLGSETAFLKKRYVNSC
jgi:hypothetical protein